MSRGLGDVYKRQFINCRALETLTLGSNVNTISQNAFTNCTSLTTLTIPSNVTYIGDNAFNSCSGLTSVTFEGTVIENGSGIYSNAFTGVGTSGGTSNPSITFPDTWTANKQDADTGAFKGGYFALGTDPVAQIGTTNYYTLKKALAEAGSGQTVKILSNTGVSTDTYLIPSGVTLDLSGYNVTANYVSVFGGSIIDTGRTVEGATVYGSLVVASNKLAYQSDNITYLPVYTGTGYKFVPVTLIAKWEKTANGDGTYKYTIYYRTNCDLAISQILTQDTSISMGFNLGYTYTTASRNVSNSLSFTSNDTASNLAHQAAESTHNEYVLYASIIQSSDVTLGDAKIFIKSGNTTTYVYSDVYAASAATLVQ